MTLTLINKEHLVDNIWAFRFQPSEPLLWIAGQFVRVELPHDNPDQEGVKRWFTNSAAPYEGILQITTRVTDTTFKQALARLEVGSNRLQLIEQPGGDFVWEDSQRPIVFVAGGIGVTPFHSILKQRVHDNLPLDVTLIYGGRSTELPFKDELAEWSAKDSQLQVEYVIGEPLTAENIVERVRNLNESLVYVSGPDPMVDTLSEDLLEHGLPKTQLKRDGFPNYTQANY